MYFCIDRQYIFACLHLTVLLKALLLVQLSSSVQPRTALLLFSLAIACFGTRATTNPTLSPRARAGVTVRGRVSEREGSAARVWNKLGLIVARVENTLQLRRIAVAVR